MEIAVYLAAFGTLRRSEVCALTADGVSGNQIQINKAMVDPGNTDWVIKTTKTISSSRVITMPQNIIATRALDKLEIPYFRFHDLRHYAASVIHAIGIPDQYIMQRSGWSSDQTLKAIYRGTMEDYQKNLQI